MYTTTMMATYHDFYVKRSTKKKRATTKVRTAAVVAAMPRGTRC
jgi:hypothetical protein